MITKIRNLLLENKFLITKYITISLGSYLLVFSLLYLFIDVFLVDKSIAFLIAYGLNYLFLYYFQLHFLFGKNHNSKRLIRFVIYILIFYLLANVIFSIGLMLDFNYFLATAITIMILFPIRFIVSKIYVFK